jgi:hypothetical protein
MEVILAISHLVRWLNSSSLRPLRKVIPDLDLLLADPAGILQTNQVHVGAGRRYGRIFGLTALASAIYWTGGRAGLLPGLQPGRAGNAWAVGMVFLAWLGGPLLIGLLIRRVADSLGPQLTLTGEGALFACRKEFVFCPWELFDTRGAQVRINMDKAILPIAWKALSKVTIEKNGTFHDGPQLNTRLLSLKPGHEVVLHGPYEADIAEVAGLLLSVAARLGKGGGQTDSAGLAPGLERPQACAAAWRGKNGWIHVRLSRFVPPRICSGCGAPTGDLVQINIASASDPILLRLPLCLACQRIGKRRCLKRLLLAIAFSLLLLPGFALLLVPLVAAGAPIQVVLPVLLVGIVVGAIAVVWLFSSARRARVPFEAGNHSLHNGTAQLRFRRSNYGDAFLAACNRGISVHPACA